MGSFVIRPVCCHNSVRYCVAAAKVMINAETAKFFFDKLWEEHQKSPADDGCRGGEERVML